MTIGDDGKWHSGPFNKAGDYEGKVARWRLDDQPGVEGKADGENYKFSLAPMGLSFTLT
jgi:hypothetical protein